MPKLDGLRPCLLRHADGIAAQVGGSGEPGETATLAHRELLAKRWMEPQDAPVRRLLGRACCPARRQ
jgi:hypothetical protein